MAEEQSPHPPFVRQNKDGVWLIQVRVQPGAKRSEVAGLLDDRLKIRLSAPAVDNKANTALVEYVASSLHLRQSKVNLVAGATSRQKTLAIESESEPDWTQLK